jgi:hypothetical protein
MSLCHGSFYDPASNLARSLDIMHVVSHPRLLSLKHQGVILYLTFPKGKQNIKRFGRIDI